MPRLSVVIPTRNTRELTLRCLESLRATGTVRLEIVVVDEASSDGTAEAIRQQLSEVVLLERAVPGGFSAAVNEGVEATTGDPILLLNSDTEVDPGALDALLAALEREPRLGVIGGRLRYPDGQPQWSGGAEPSRTWLFSLASGLATTLGRVPGWRRLRPPSGSADSDEPQPVHWVPGAALALRREVWESCGPLDEGYRFYAQDLDLCAQARAEGWKIAVVPDFTVMHHHGATLAGEASDVEADRPPQRFDLLWPDLVRWCAKAGGAAAGRSAAGALFWGGTLRLLGRRLASPLAGSSRRRHWREEAVFLRRALGSCASALRGAPPT